MKLQKRLELLPEGAIYLIERGSLFCWKDIQAGLDDIEGAPITVQQAFTELIGKDDTRKYQVIDKTDFLAISAQFRFRSLHTWDALGMWSPAQIHPALATRYLHPG